MCVSPLTIPNPSRRFYQGLSQNYINVPCGQCYQCNDQKRNEWFVRSNAEFEYYDSIGGSVWFFTLTYNDANIPVFVPCIFDYYEEILCFSRSDLQRFLKRVRTNLNRGYISGQNGDNVKYLICCEYGENTLRPHYHGLLFLPFTPTEHDVYCLLRDSWSKYDRHTRKHYPIGFVSFSNKGGRVFNSNAIKYVTKYITKDFDASFTLYNKYLAYFNEQKIENPDVKRFSDVYRHFMRDVKPFHLQSIGFGLPLLFECVKDGLLTQAFIADKKRIKGVNYNYSYPTYIKRKLLNYKIDDVTYFDNKYTYYLKSQYERIYDKTLCELEKQCSFIHIHSIPNGALPLGETHDSLYKKIVNFKNEIPLCDLTTYSLSLRNYTMDSCYFGVLDGYNPLNMLSHGRSLYVLQRTYNDGFISGSKLSLEEKKYISKRSSLQNKNSLTKTIFANYEQFLKLLESIQFSLRKAKSNYQLKARRIQKSLRDKENTKIYG